MTSREIDKEITATARQLIINIYKHYQITLQLSAASREIEDYLDNPASKTRYRLKGLVSKTGAAARLTTQTSDRIRHLSYQLRTLLDQEEDKNE